MNIGIISNVHGYSWAGSEEVWKNLAECALDQKHRVTAMLHPDIGKSPHLLGFTQKGGVLRFWKPSPLARLQTFKERCLPTFPSSLLDSFDVLLVSLGSLPAMTYVPGLVDGLLKTRTPFVLLCQFNADHLYFSSQERETVRKITQKASHIVFVSEANLQTARRQLALPLNHSRVLSNPNRGLGAPPPPWPSSTLPLSLACVARLETHWKGQDILLDALSRPPWPSRDWRLQFYGEGPDRDYLEQLISFYGLDSRVRMVGYERDLSVIWRENHLFILPSHGEGLPLALLECLGMGRPALVTDVGGSASLIQEGVNGFVAKAATVPCLSSALERAWDNRERWKEMGENALKSAQERAFHPPSLLLLDYLQEASRGDISTTPIH